MRSRPILLAAAVTAALALAACGGASSTSSSATSSSATSTSSSSSAAGTASASQSAASTTAGGTLSYEGVPIEGGPALGPSATTSTSTVDGIRCGATEQLAYHIHAHLAVYVGGALQSLPAGIGIPGSQAQQTSQGPIAAGGQCIYWLHTHTADGIIHVESPTQRVYTLGNFFDEWGQPLTTEQAATAKGKITAYLNGKPWTKSVRKIPLLPHAVIQLQIGDPAPPPQTVNWATTGL